MAMRSRRPTSTRSARSRPRRRARHGCDLSTHRCTALQDASHSARSSRQAFLSPISWRPSSTPIPTSVPSHSPIPEGRGALDLACATARRSGAELVIANAPDGDRLAVAIPDDDAPGGWRTLTGDQVGALLGAYLLGQDAAEADQGTTDPDDAG